MGCILSPGLVPLCFRPVHPELQSFDVGCPTRSQKIRTNAAEDHAEVAFTWDYVAVEITGVVAASVAAAASLGRIKGTSTPYNVPVALALLKLSTGGLTAVLSLLLMRGEFVPGLPPSTVRHRSSPGLSFAATPSRSSPGLSTARARLS